MSTTAHTINPSSGRSLNPAAQTTAASPNALERGGLVAAGGWVEVAQIVADPAAVVGVATAGAGLAKVVVKEAGATIRQGMAERTNRQAGAPSSGPTSTGSDGQT